MVARSPRTTVRRLFRLSGFIVIAGFSAMVVGQSRLDFPLSLLVWAVGPVIYFALISSNDPPSE